MNRASLVSAILLGLVSALFLLAWSAWWSPRQPHIHVSDVGAWTPPVIGVALFLALVNAVAEEAFWRAFFGAALLEGAASRPPAILGQGLGFGLMHLYGFPDGWLGVAATTVFGITAMLLSVRSGSIWPAIIAHGIADTAILIQILA
jgi:uncharacterized protein